MGQDESALDDLVAPHCLSARTLAGVAEYINEGPSRKRIVVLTGAGISTAAGIPDFRSPKTGLYHKIARLNLPYAEAVFDIGYFRRCPEPFYCLARELYPGNFQPTISHAFLALLARKRLLQMLFTQNIDCLERAAGVPADKIVEAHGSFASQRCIDCKTAFPDAEMRQNVAQAKVPRCMEAGCDGIVKPDIVFFGEPLPSTFSENAHQTAMADLVLVMGTSLTVYPFAGLPAMARDGTPRLLVNLEHVAQIGGRPDDVIELGQCDRGIRRLADALGWRDELEQLWRATVGEDEARRQLRRSQNPGDAAEDAIQDLVDGVEAALHLDHAEHSQKEEEKEKGVDDDDDDDDDDEKPRDGLAAASLPLGESATTLDDIRVEQQPQQAAETSRARQTLRPGAAPRLDALMRLAAHASAPTRSDRSGFKIAS